MPHLTSIFASVFRSRFSAGSVATEPLDHACLIGAGHQFLDDLPLPAFAIGMDGSVKLVGKV